MDSIANSVDAASFESLARETRSVAAQRTASICKGASDSGFLVKLNGQVLTAKSKQAVPQAESFGFSLRWLDSQNFQKYNFFANIKVCM